VGVPASGYRRASYPALGCDILPAVPLYAFNGTIPLLGHQAFVFTTAVLIGDVVLDEGANVWPGAVLRGDVERIHLGAHTSFQDNSVAHTDPGFPVSVGPDCVIGHNVILHGATVGARCLIGMGAILLNGCVVGDECIVGAGALLTQGKVFAPRSLIIGSPAKAVREVTDDDLRPRVELRDRYARRSLAYLEAGLGAIVEQR
jgi:carbonic anhydrase/acetyltransferase-like protein (isoleucine patch superfamily)